MGTHTDTFKQRSYSLYIDSQTFDRRDRLFRIHGGDRNPLHNSFPAGWYDSAKTTVSLPLAVHIHGSVRLGGETQSKRFWCNRSFRSQHIAIRMGDAGCPKRLDERADGVG